MITAISANREQARDEARRQIAFYSTTVTYDALLDLHGWREQKEAIRAAFRKFDIAAMTAAVTDDMVDQIAVAGTPDECKQALAKYDGLLDHVLLYPPSFGVKHGRLLDNYALIRDICGPANEGN